MKYNFSNGSIPHWIQLFTSGFRNLQKTLSFDRVLHVNFIWLIIPLHSSSFFNSKRTNHWFSFSIFSHWNIQCQVCWWSTNCQKWTIQHDEDKHSVKLFSCSFPCKFSRQCRFAIFILKIYLLTIGFPNKTEPMECMLAWICKFSLVIQKDKKIPFRFISIAKSFLIRILISIVCFGNISWKVHVVVDQPI